MTRLLRLYYTLRPLKWRQWWYRAWHPFAMKLSRRRKNADPHCLNAALRRPPTMLQALIVPPTFKPEGAVFTFLNQTVRFDGAINWGFREHGLLWLFNLHYFEWLYDDGLTIAKRLETMQDYSARAAHGPAARHPYPASLRVVAWTRFLTRFGVTDRTLIDVVYADADWLCRFPEYSLDGNHLWENSCGLLAAGAFFKSQRLLRKGARLLKRCIETQLLPDGGHAESSPMYHSLLLWRTMQCIELMRLAGPQAGILQHAAEAAERMLGWIQAISFSDGSWPAVNDTTSGIAPTTQQLASYAAALGITPVFPCNHGSGYYLVQRKSWELFVDAASIHPPWQPGHAHADTGNFCLHVAGKPIIVDTGISTYEPSGRRLKERSSPAHNVAVYKGRNSSDVWKSFRMGRRAKVSIQSFNDRELAFRHTGYAQAGIKANRRFEWGDTTINIFDALDGAEENATCIYLHFHPACEVEQLDATTCRFNGGQIQAGVSGSVTLEAYDYCDGFNKRIPARRACIVALQNHCNVQILID